MIVHGLLQKARIDASALGYRVRPGLTKPWTVWRMTPVGWAWDADFAHADDAHDYLLSKLSQEAHPV